MQKIINFIKENKTKIGWVVVTLIAGGLGTLLSGGFDAYKTYEQPPLSPPAILFPIVWTLLYILMGIAAGIVAESRDLDKGKGLKLYVLQLAINVIWPIIFFRFDALKFACFWLVLLIVAVVLTIFSFYRIDKKAAFLLLPYLAWCLFALYLNFGIVVLNV
ncbi:MAG: tryptophan-rich sensory protein [Clostridia bacterium]|nr:tryptophan-rich sensory protein [Clostridia bacterium]